MTRKRRRLTLALLALSALAVATALVLNAFQDSIVFFRSPSDVVERKVPAASRFRLGGLVEEGSVRRLDGEATTGGRRSAAVAFRVTDLKHSVEVRFTGILPDLFREGQGVVAEGRLGGDGVFEATEVLAKHDETYMPPEVADALKRAGRWQEEGPKSQGGGK
ncbi:MAG: cytochrome c maturation protein CcmE [Proteobacteria bacterium]|nr:cytochrome c maturation protein CcmE [Pseudomonadota bacterium]